MVKTRLIILFGTLFFMSCSKIKFEKEGIYELSPEASILWYNQPSSEYYSSKYNRTYFAYLSNNMCIYIKYFDHDLKVFSTPYKVKAYHKYSDDHGSPVLHIIKRGVDKGKIVLSYAHHNSELFFIKSHLAEDIYSWDKEMLISKEACTYPNLVETDEGELLVFYKKNIPDNSSTSWTRNLCFKKSYDFGNTWEREVELVNFEQNTWIYPAPIKGKGTEIHIVFSYKKPYSVDVVDLFYIQSKNNGKNWTDYEGNVLKTPIEMNEIKPFYETMDGYQTRAWDLNLKYNYPIFTFVDYADKEVIGYYGFIKNERINTQKVSNLSTCYYPGGITLDDNNPEIVYLSNEKGTTTSIESWYLNKSNRQFSKKKIIHSDDAAKHFMPQSVKNYSEIPLIWMKSEYYKSFSDFNSDLQFYLLPN